MMNFQKKARTGTSWSSKLWRRTGNKELMSVSLQVSHKGQMEEQLHRAGEDEIDTDSASMHINRLK